MIPCGTATSPPVRNHGRCYLHRRGQGGTHQAWIVPHWTDLGEPSTSTTPVKWRARTAILERTGRIRRSAVRQRGNSPTDSTSPSTSPSLVQATNCLPGDGRLGGDDWRDCSSQ